MRQKQKSEAMSRRFVRLGSKAAEAAAKTAVVLQGAQSAARGSHGAVISKSDQALVLLAWDEMTWGCIMILAIIFFLAGWKALDLTKAALIRAGNRVVDKYFRRAVPIIATEPAVEVTPTNPTEPINTPDNGEDDILPGLLATAAATGRFPLPQSYGAATYRTLPSKSGYLFWMPNIRGRGPTSCAHIKSNCGGLHDPEAFFLALDHPLVGKIHWCPNCATEENKRRYGIIQRPASYDDETSRVLLNLTLGAGWTMLPPRNNMPGSDFLKKTYKDLQAFANHLGVPLLVPPTAHPIIMRPSQDTVDFTDIIHHIEGRAGQTPPQSWRFAGRQPPHPPPGPPPPDHWSTRIWGPPLPSVPEVGEGARQRRPRAGMTVEAVLPNLD